MNKSLLAILVLFSAQAFAATLTAREAVMIPANSTSIQVMDSNGEATREQMNDENDPSNKASAICQLVFAAKPSPRVISKNSEFDISNISETQTLEDANNLFISMNKYSIEQFRQMALENGRESSFPAVVQSVDDVAAALAYTDGFSVELAKQLMPTRIEIQLNKNSAVLNCLVLKHHASNSSASEILLQLMSKYGKLDPSSKSQTVEEF